MIGLHPDERLGKLTINGVDMHTPAWNVLDPTVLYQPTDFVGENLRIPGAHGRRAYPLWIDQGHFLLPMLISGEVDQSGNLYATTYLGAQTNLDYLNANVTTPPAAPTATQAATLLMPDGSTRNANVQVFPIRPENLYLTKTLFRATLELIIPDAAGCFA